MDTSIFIGTWWSLVPPLLAIILALVTKEVYSSLFIGVAVGALLYTGFHPWNAFNALFSIMKDSMNLNILIFDVLLGMIIVLMSKSGGSAAYGRWAGSKIRSKKSAMLATTGLGMLIFVDDYFNCLTVGSVMRPVTDRYKVSRAKLAYIIDATAAPAVSYTHLNECSRPFFFCSCGGAESAKRQSGGYYHRGCDGCVE